MSKKVFLLVAIFILSVFGISRAAIVYDLAGPSDYGAATTSNSYSLQSFTVGDTRQGQVNDCWFWSSLASILHQQPGYLSRNYEVQADGTVNVTFYKNGLPITYQVTNGINTWWGDPTTSNDDSNGDAAGDIMQKAFAAFRNPSNTMADENFGLPSEAMAAFGLTSGFLPFSMSAIDSAWAQGDVINVDTGFSVPAGAVEDHSYSVWSVDAAAGTAVLRSPWGDGYAGFNEFINVDDAWLRANSVGVFYGQFGGDSPPIHTPEPHSLAVMIGLGMLLRRKR